MLIVPLSGRVSLKNPPVATILLILANCMVYFFIQSGDREINEEASRYYLSSGLAAIEVSAHERYLKDGASFSLTDQDVADKDLPKDDFLSRTAAMQNDREFMDGLKHGWVITPEKKIYPAWKDRRGHYDALMSNITVMRFGYIPAQGGLKSALVHMFLHGGFMHLLGNMIFLWLAGCVIELAFGRIGYGVLYTAGGLCAVGLYALANPGSTFPLIGASGAVAALMGAYAVLYGRKKIKVFYSVGFYFNYTLVPGFVILGLWLGNELVQLLFDRSSQVAYMAHVGGFSCGALMGFVGRRFPGSAHALDPDPKQRVASLLDEALKKIEHLDMTGARPLLEEVLRIDHGNITALTQMYHMDKVRPDSKEFYSSAVRLLSHLVHDRQAHRETQAIYQEYLQKAAAKGLPASLLFSIISCFASTGHVEDAEKVVGVLLSRQPDLPRIPESLLFLARACIKNGLPHKARNYLQVICIRYPLSSENTVAKRLLDDLET